MKEALSLGGERFATRRRVRGGSRSIPKRNGREPERSAFAGAATEVATSAQDRARGAEARGGGIQTQRAAEDLTLGELAGQVRPFANCSLIRVGG